MADQQQAAALTASLRVVGESYNSAESTPGQVMKSLEVPPWLTPSKMSGEVAEAVRARVEETKPVVAPDEDQPCTPSAFMTRMADVYDDITGEDFRTRYGTWDNFKMVFYAIVLHLVNPQSNAHLELTEGILWTLVASSNISTAKSDLNTIMEYLKVNSSAHVVRKLDRSKLRDIFTARQGVPTVRRGTVTRSLDLSKKLEDYVSEPMTWVRLSSLFNVQEQCLLGEIFQGVENLTNILLAAAYPDGVHFHVNGGRPGKMFHDTKKEIVSQCLQLQMRQTFVRLEQFTISGNKQRRIIDKDAIDLTNRISNDLLPVSGAMLKVGMSQKVDALHVGTGDGVKVEEVKFGDNLVVFASIGSISFSQGLSGLTLTKSYPERLKNDVCFIVVNVAPVEGRCVAA